MDFISLMEVTTTAGTTTYVIDEDRKIDKDHLKNVGKTSLVTSTTTIAGQILEKALLALNLVDNDSNNNVKIV